MNPLDELNSLVALFGEATDLLERADHVPASQIPEPYKKLLVHDQHMTVTMEAYHGDSVNVEILNQRLEDDLYVRKILLRTIMEQKIVQFGIVRFHLEYVTNRVRDEILSGKIPLGRVLINHNVLRHIDLGAILRISAGPDLADCMRIAPGMTTYGRLATIFCDSRPAVDLLEIASPSGD